MKTVLLLGGPAAGQRVEVHGNMGSVYSGDLDGRMTNTLYKVVPMCSHGEVHWFGVLDGADPLALLIAGYGMNVVPKAERHTGTLHDRNGDVVSAPVRGDTYGDQS